MGCVHVAAAPTKNPLRSCHVSPIVAALNASSGVDSGDTLPSNATSGVVNVDQPLQIGPFAAMLRSMADHLRSPAFPSIWEKFLEHMHTDRLTADAQELLRTTSTPRQELVLGYWHDILNRPTDELEAAVGQMNARLRTASLPYLVVAGEDVDDGYRDWLQAQIPHASIVVLSGSGHFPQLAHPDMFAQCLADTAAWPVR